MKSIFIIVISFTAAAVQHADRYMLSRRLLGLILQISNAR